MKRALHLVVLMGVVATLAAPAAYADDGRIGGQPGAVRIIGSTDIRMESETVQAHLYGRFAEYVVDFKFVNSGPEQEVRLGFPFGLDDKTLDSPPVALAGFLAYRDGEPLEVTITEGMDGPLRVGWFEHTAVFPPGVSMIRVRYVTRPSVIAGAPEDASRTAPAGWEDMMAYSARYTYTLHTGADWADTIGRAVVRFTASPELQGWELGAAEGEVWGTGPAGSVRGEDGSILWVFEDFEPLADPDTGQSPYDIGLAYWGATFMSRDHEEGSEPAYAQPVVAARASNTSSVLEYDYPKFSADRAADGDPSTAWITPDGLAADQWLELELTGVAPAAELRLVGGYPRTPEEYRAHGRPKRIEVRFPDGTSEEFELADEPVVQRLPLGRARVDEARIVVTEVYPGTTYDDVAVAELEFGTTTAPAFLTFEEALALEAPPVTFEPEPAGETSLAPPAAVQDEEPPAEDATLDAWVLLGGLAVLTVGVLGVMALRTRAG